MKRTVRSIFALLMVLMLMSSFLTVFASASESEQQTYTENETPAPEKPTDEPEKQKQSFTVIYMDAGKEGEIARETVEEGAKPLAVPTANAAGRTIGGWALNDKFVEPADMEITADTTFTAWYSPQLVTDKHIKYISGNAQKDGSCYTFNPNGKLTRAQAATIFYNLLADTSEGYGEVSFTDVKTSDWYYTAVRVLASNLVLAGYKDGTFRPTAAVTRAEFVTMLLRLMPQPEAKCSFSDVRSDAWYYGAVAAAANKGWVNGYMDGCFGPNRTISRAEAVTIVNRALGRHADMTLLKKSQFLVYTDVANTSFWAFGDIMEASVSHEYKTDENGERWTSYEIPRSGLRGGMQTLGGSVYCVDEKTGAFVRNSWIENEGNRFYFGSDGVLCKGVLSLDGKWYYLDPTTGAAQTGLRYIDGWYYDFKLDGGTRQTPKERMNAVAKNRSSNTKWLLLVDVTACRTGVYWWDGAKWALEYFWECAPGAPGHETPTGSYTVGIKGYSFYSYGSWQYYYTGFIGGTYLFHSITYNSDGSVQDGTLGKAVSHGCVRLATQNAKWIYNNIPTKSAVYIYE